MPTATPKGTEVVVKYGGEFMDLGDQADNFGRRTKAVEAILGIISINTIGLDFFSRPIGDITVKDLYEKLFNLQDGVQRARMQIQDRNLERVAKETGLYDRLVGLQECVERAKAQVRKELHH
jgi:hypothetical protein